MVLGCQKVLPYNPPQLRLEYSKTFALPVVLSADSSHQSSPMALLDEWVQCRVYASRLSLNEVSALVPLMGNYLVHLEFWQLSKSHSPETYLAGILRFSLR